VRLVVQPDGAQPVTVELAPGWYLDKQGLHFSERDRVHVEGRREERDGKSVLVVRRVGAPENGVVLRNELDRPTWEQHP